MPAPKRTSAEHRRVFQAHLGSALRQLGIAREFRQLVADGCDVNTLTALLLALGSFAHEDRWERLTGLGRRKRGTVLRRIGQCAKDIERLNASWIGQIVLAAATKQPGIVAHLLALPKVLSIYANVLGNLLRERRLQPRSGPHKNNARALLTQYVTLATGRPHDNEVARLVSVVLNRRNLTADAQKDWRGQHESLLRRTAPVTISLKAAVPHPA